MWQWLWALDRKGAPSEPFDNRLAEQGLRTAADPAGTFIAASDSKSDAQSANSTAQLNPVQRAWEQGWKDVFSRLPADDQSLLFEMLHAAMAHQTLSPDKTKAASELIEHGHRLWDDYQAVAFQSVADLKGDDQAQWIDVLRQVNERFANDVRPALSAIVDGRTPTEAEHAALGGLQTTLVALTLAQVQDDTVVFRPAEREIWFYELARVRDFEAGQLDKASLGRVAYLQLFKQPADYRGKLVTVLGTVRLAYRVPAPPNYLGVKEYSVYWIHPAGGPDSPLIVYAIGTPPGFPSLAARNGAAHQSSATLREDVEVTGVFFKRCAYAAKGGTYTAPLLIANVPKWRRPQTANVPIRAPFTPLELAAGVIVALLLAICATAVLWKRSRHSRRAIALQRTGGFAPLGNLTVGPSPEESIRELERQARGEEGV
jgi:hypothetical protein